MKFRAIQSSLLFLGAITCVQAQTSPGFAYQSTGATLNHILAELSKTSGITLKASAQLGGDVFAIRTTGTSFESLEKKIARVENGVWIDTANGKTLKQSSDAARSDEALHADIVMSAYRAAIRNQIEGLQTQPAFDDQGAEALAKRAESELSRAGDSRDYTIALKNLEPLSPSHRAIVRLLSSFGAEELAGLPLRIKTTYATNPNSAQRDLPAGALEAAQEYLSEQTLWARKSQGRHFSTPRYKGQNLNLPNFLADQRIPLSSPSKILVNVYRETEVGRLIVELVLAGSDGSVLNRTTGSIYPSDSSAKASLGEANSWTHPVEPSAEALAFTHGFDREINGGLTRSTLLHPESSDPLAIAYGSTLVKLSQDENVDLVANLSDKCFDGGFHQFKFSSSKEYLGTIAKMGQSCWTEDECLMVAPVDRFGDRAARAERGALGTYLRSASSGTFSIEDQAASALALPDPLENLLPATLLGKLVNRAVALKDVALLKFYGALSPEDRQRATSSAGLPLNELSSPVASEALNELVFARSNPLIVRRAPSEIWREPSECLASGLPSGSTLHLAIQSQDSVFDLNQDKLQFRLSEGAVGAGEVAFAQYQTLHPEKYPIDPNLSQSPNSAHFQVGQLKSYLFDFRFLSNVSATPQLECRSLDPNGPYKLSELPDSFVTEVSKKLAEIQRDESGASSQIPTRTSSAPK